MNTSTSGFTWLPCPPRNKRAPILTSAAGETGEEAHSDNHRHPVPTPGR